MMTFPISEEQYERLVRSIERRLPKAAEFYIGRTNDLARRRWQHDEHRTGVDDFDCMVRLGTFRTPQVCKEVEACLIREFKGCLRCVNIDETGCGRFGPGPQHLYLMWRERRGRRR